MSKVAANVNGTTNGIQNVAMNWCRTKRATDLVRDDAWSMSSFRKCSSLHSARSRIYITAGDRVYIRLSQL